MEKNWNEVELSNLRKKSYTLNNEFVLGKNTDNENNGHYKTVEDGGDATTATPTAAENANKSELLKPGSDIKPKVNSEDVEALLRRLYGITLGEVKELISYDDRNYLVTEDPNIKNPLIVPHCPHGYVLKILNSLDSKKTDFVDAQNELMVYLSKQDIRCPKPIANVYGKHFSVEHISGADHIVRLLEFIPGKIFHEVEKTNYLLFQSGEYLAKIDRGLKNFSHAAYDTHTTLWMLQSVPKIKDFMYILKDHERKSLVEEVMESFEKEVLSKLTSFETQIIHGDYNEQNIVVEKVKGDAVDEYKVSGIIDFGDTNKSPIIFEVGIAMAYILLQSKSLEKGGIFLAGYTSIRPIKSKEKQYLKYCVAARLAVSLVMGLYTHSLDPSNEYVLVTQEQGWILIEQLWREQFDKIDEIWETAGVKYLTQSTK